MIIKEVGIVHSLSWENGPSCKVERRDLNRAALFHVAERISKGEMDGKFHVTKSRYDFGIQKGLGVGGKLPYGNWKFIEI